jgi:hypothetical protein
MANWPPSPCTITADLRPCPMCGGRAACNNYITEAAVFCVNVKCRLSITRGHGRSDEGVDEAIAAWNTRATAAPVVVGEDVRDAARFRALARTVEYIRLTPDEPNDADDDYLARMADAAIANQA